MPDREIEVRAWRDSLRYRPDMVRLSIWSPTHTGSVVMTEIKAGDEFGLIEPAMNLTGEQAQVLMDSLWDCGVRPSAGHGSSGQREALEHHLAHVTRLLDAVMPSAVRKEDK